MKTTSQVVVDTSAFFAGTKRLREIMGKGVTLSTIDLIVFEFTKVMEDEINRARGAGNTKRAQMLRNIRDRFPQLLKDLDVDVASPTFSSADVSDLYSLIAKGYDSGDAMIWIKMKKVGMGTILTDNISDWKKLGASVIAVS